MSVPLFRVPSRNSRLLDDTAAARAERARGKECARRRTCALVSLLAGIVFMLVVQVFAAWRNGRL